MDTHLSGHGPDTHTAHGRRARRFLTARVASALVTTYRRLRWCDDDPPGWVAFVSDRGS